MAESLPTAGLAGSLVLGCALALGAGETVPDMPASSQPEATDKPRVIAALRLVTCEQIERNRARAARRPPNLSEIGSLELRRGVVRIFHTGEVEVTLKHVKGPTKLTPDRQPVGKMEPPYTFQVIYEGQPFGQPITTDDKGDFRGVVGSLKTFKVLFTILVTTDASGEKSLVPGVLRRTYRGTFPDTAELEQEMASVKRGTLTMEWGGVFGLRSPNPEGAFQGAGSYWQFTTLGASYGTGDLCHERVIPPPVKRRVGKDPSPEE